MPVKWWVLTQNRYPRFILAQLSPFGVRFTNDILYREEIEPILAKKKPPLKGLTVQLLGPNDWKTAKALSESHGLMLGDYAQPQVAFALLDGVPIGHVCLSSGTIYLKGLEMEESFDDGLYLFNLFISPEARRHGIAKFLMISALELANGNDNHRYAYAYVREDNLASRHLVESLGLREMEVVHYLRAFGFRSYQTEAPQ